MSLSAAGARRIAAAAQATAAGVIGWLLTLRWGWHWPGALAAGIAVVLFALALGVGLAFAMTRYGFGVPRRHWPPPAPPQLAAGRHTLRPTEALAFLASECTAVFRMFNWLQPFRSRRSFTHPKAAAPGSDAPTVLLVHGYACNHAVWLDLQPTLAAAGYRCEAIDLEPLFGSIDGYAQALLQRVRQISARTGQRPLLVCHSMGGLAARAAAVLAGQDEFCRGIVTLGSPHHGCALARFSGGHNARQMRCGSEWLRALAAAETPALRAQLVSVFSWHDSIVGPPCTSWLDGARHIALAGLGHVSLLRHPRAVAAVLEALDTLRHAPR